MIRVVQTGKAVQLGLGHARMRTEKPQVARPVGHGVETLGDQRPVPGADFTDGQRLVFGQADGEGS